MGRVRVNLRSIDFWVLKDRQQEVRAVLVASHYIGTSIYMSLHRQYMYYIPLTTSLSGLFIDIKHLKIT